MTTLIKNGTIITAADSYKADILVKNGVIYEIGREISKIASEIIDATDKWVLPGGVDVHTHLDSQWEAMPTVDDFETATAAAAAGGTTTVVDYAEQAPGGSLEQALEQWKAKASPRAVIDYGFHIALSELSDTVLSQLPAMADAGITSFKISLDMPSERRFSDAAVLDFLQRAAAAGAIACVHAENGEIIELLLRRTTAEARTTTRFLNAVRPPELEGEATGRMITLADVGKIPLYLTGLSSAHALEKVKAARDRGQPVYAETCSHYLVLGSERYEEADGIRFYCTPPLRPSWHQDVLWKGIMSGDIQVVASDHAAFNLAGQKDAGKDNFSLAPPGLPGIQERLSLLHAAGVTTGRVSVNRYVDLVSTTPARLFGLFPRKGTIAVGSDADMIIFDPKADQVLSKSISLSRSDFCTFEGIKVRGAPWLVLLRGRVISREGKVMGRPGSGEFVPRARFG